MRTTIVACLIIALGAGLAGCVADGTAPGTRTTGPGFGSADFGGCPPVNIGTPQNPRLIKDPACGRS